MYSYLLLVLLRHLEWLAILFSGAPVTSEKALVRTGRVVYKLLDAQPRRVQLIFSAIEDGHGFYRRQEIQEDTSTDIMELLLLATRRHQVVVFHYIF